MSLELILIAARATELERDRHLGNAGAGRCGRALMQLRRIYLRYFPPGLRLEYSHANGTTHKKTIDLLTISPESNIQLVVNQLVESERLLTKATIPKLKELLHRLVDKQLEVEHAKKRAYQLHSVVRPHTLPMTNFCFSKYARLVATGSYDKSIKLTHPLQRKPTALDDKLTLVGHESVVYSLTFNAPHATHLLSGSFDKTCRIWDVATQSCKGIYRGHEGEVVGVGYSPNTDQFGSCSMDCTTIIWDIEKEQELFALVGHTAEVSCLAFDSTGQFVATGACDAAVRLWDTRFGGCFRSLEAHTAEISHVMFDHPSHMLVSSAADHTCRVWDTRTGKCLFELTNHQDEVNDATFNSTGALLATCGADGKAFIYDTLTGTLRARLVGHSQSVAKVCFNMQGSLVLTASADGTARVWDSFSGECLQVLRGHEEEVFSCGFSYCGELALTASTDNSVRVWQREKEI